MSLKGNKKIKSSAEVVDKHLILSLPNAIEPIVWRMELSKMGTASFEIKKIKSSDVHKLVLKPKKGVAEPIAQFEDKETALNALLQASDAMQRPGHNEPSIVAPSNNVPNSNVQSTPTQSKNKTSNKWLYLFLGFVAVIALYIYMTMQIPKKITDQTNSSETTIPSSSNKVPVGVPLSADDFLNGL